MAHFLHARIRLGTPYRRIEYGQGTRTIEAARNLAPAWTEEVAMANYRGVELAPHTLESLVTWDVSGHAQRERDRMTPAYRTPKVVQGGY